MLFSTWLRYWKRSLEGQSAQKQSRRRRPSIRRVAPRPRLEALEDRTLLTAAWLSAAGAIGDSYTAPYFNRFGPNTHNWVEALADLRGINFGGPASPGTDQRGYANIWGGPNSYGGVNVAAPGLASQISGGNVNLAVDELGTHDFISYPIPNSSPWEQTGTLSPSVSGTVFSDIYNGTLSGDALQTYTNQVVGNLGQTLDDLSGAGSARVVAFNIGDFSKVPAISLLGFTDATKLARYSSAVATADAQYETLAAQKHIPMIDFAGFSQLVSSGSVVVGGVSLDLTHFTSPATPTDFFADAQHAGTVAQGLIANMVIEAADKAYGAEIAPLSDQEILGYAGIAFPSVSEPTYFDVSRFVHLNTGPVVNIRQDQQQVFQGDLDPTFGNAGIKTTNLGSSDDEATNVVAQPDGKLLVVGYTYAGNGNDALTVSRYLANGSLDTSYGSGGTVITDLMGSLSGLFNSPNASSNLMALQPDGSLLILWGNELVRYTASGSLDTSFGNDGVTTLNDYGPGLLGYGGPGLLGGPPSGPYAIALLSDGKILVAGSITVGGPSGSDNTYVVDTLLERLNSDGSVDTSFGTGGQVIQDFGLHNEYTDVDQSTATSLSVQPNGAILVGGEITDYQGPFSPEFDGFVARFDSNGNLDTSFGTGGKVVLVNTYNGTDGGPQRLSFIGPSAVGINERGSEAYDTSVTPTAFLLQADSKILVDIGMGRTLIRLNADGTIDRSFLPDNLTFTGLTVPAYPTVGYRLDGAGRIVAAFSGLDWDPVTGNTDSLTVMRFNLDGTPDVSFGSIIASSPDHVPGSDIDLGTDPQAADLAIQPDGNIVVVGTSFDQNKQGWDATLVRLIGQTPPIQSLQGAVVSLNGVVGRDPDYPDPSTTFTYQWTVTKDGSPYDPGTPANGIDFQFAPSDTGTYVVTLTATDPEGASSSCSQTIVVTPLTSQSLQDTLTSGGTVTLQASTPSEASIIFAAANGLDPATTPTSTLIVDLGGQTVQDTVANVPPQVTLQIINGTFIGGSPAFIVQSGQVIVQNSTFSNTTNAATILVTGGSLTLRGDTIEESTGYSQAAIAIIGGTVDLGTASDPGGNTINVNGAGSLVSSTAPAAVSAVGDTFQNNGAAINPFNTTTVTASANPSLLNQSVTFTATVQPAVAGSTPTGTVQFRIDGANAGTPVALSNGRASLTTSTLPAGTHTITALYGGDGFYLGSSGSLSQSVQYKFSGFLPPLGNGLVFAVNRAIPIKVTLSDYNGNAITSLSAVTSLQIQALDAHGNPVGAPFNPTPTGGTGLSNSGQYLFNWQTKGLSAGIYEIVLTLADGTTRTKTITLTAGSSSAGLVTGSSGGTSSAGALLGGEVDLYVDNNNGDLTDDELARIQDAVNSIDATIAPYGVAITAVSDPTQANVTLNLAATSALGGLAQGVLGCTTDADQVTMIQGWNWHAGSDPAQIGTGQYDFETAVMHELGHVLGLGHSSSATSLMYATLAPGTTDRTLTAADLNVPDTDGGPCALQAGVNAPVSGPSRTSAGGVSLPGGNDPLSAVDQLLSSADLTRLLSSIMHVYQSERSSLLALWRQADALFAQRFDALLSMGAGFRKIGGSNNTPTAF